MTPGAVVLLILHVLFVHRPEPGIPLAFVALTANGGFRSFQCVPQIGFQIHTGGGAMAGRAGQGLDGRADLVV